MSTVEMEVFSDGQLVILAILMFVSGKVFTSTVRLHLVRSKLRRSRENQCQVNSSGSNGLCSPTNSLNEVELGTKVAAMADPERSSSHFDISQGAIMTLNRENLKHDSIKFLGTVVLGYFSVIHVVWVLSVLVYIAATSSANDVLTRKGLQTFTFSVFTTVSTFASGGFIPTNESMMVFRKNSGLLLILLPQVLLGNTLFPSCLRFSIWFIGKFVKKGEARFLLRNTEEIGYFHLLPGLHSSLLVMTVSGFILVQFVLFCSMEWNSAALGGLNAYQKVIGGLFQTVNARHSGETIVDPSNIAPAILVVFIVMIAYGNVGFTTGYSCSRQLKPDGSCEDKWFGFSGKWSDEGKVILILVMFLGRLKKSNMEGGKAWKLL
ncbi:hypothetical protein RJ639_002854 [Escallonia herrerae]|uniref:Uncharacterized protein n=1 Tax=Escallonia herrerae TaxID=1293975 RepID=A0AA88W0U6_9ASTE|nr:hypothetical protein RJ639_002854 [Escallonia herrerae]